MKRIGLPFGLSKITSPNENVRDSRGGRIRSGGYVFLRRRRRDQRRGISDFCSPFCFRWTAAKLRSGLSGKQHNFPANLPFTQPRGLAAPSGRGVELFPLDLRLFRRFFRRPLSLDRENLSDCPTLVTPGMARRCSPVRRTCVHMTLPWTIPEWAWPRPR